MFIWWTLWYCMLILMCGHVYIFNGRSRANTERLVVWNQDEDWSLGNHDPLLRMYISEICNMILVLPTFHGWWLSHPPIWKSSGTLFKTNQHQGTVLSWARCIQCQRKCPLRRSGLCTRPLLPLLCAWGDCKPLNSPSSKIWAYDSMQTAPLG